MDSLSKVASKMLICAYLCNNMQAWTAVLSAERVYQCWDWWNCCAISINYNTQTSESSCFDVQAWRRRSQHAKPQGAVEQSRHIMLRAFVLNAVYRIVYNDKTALSESRRSGVQPHLRANEPYWRQCYRHTLRFQ